MQNRYPVNSKTLKDKFSHIYKDFFLKNNLVISAPNVINWGHVFSDTDVDVRIQQKIPTKMFLGVNTRNGSAVKSGNITYFCKKSQKYVSAPLESVVTSTDVGHLEGEIKKVFEKLGYDKGIEINVLTESERGHGIIFSGVISLLLICVLYRLQGKFTKDQLENHDEFSDSHVFKEIYDLSVSLYKQFCFVNNSLTPYVAMTSSCLPSVQIQNDSKLLINSKMDCQTMDKLFDLDEVFNKPTIDYGIISYGGLYADCYSSISTTDIDREFRENISYIKNYTNIDNNITSQSESIKNILNNLNIKLIRAWENILKNPYNKDLEDKFIDVVSEHGMFYSFLENEKDIHSATTYLFNKNKITQDEKLGLTSISSGKSGGCFLFVTRYKKSRETINKLLISLRENGYPNANFEYLSWEDGVSNESLKIEQDISNNIYSQYINKDDVTFEDTYGQKYIGNYDKTITLEKDTLIFDTIHKKVFFNGVGLTYKDLRSQSATVDIVNILFQHTESSIKNTQFPISSYSKSKNEMLGKIVLPLQKFVKDNFGEKLNIKCSGGLYDFYMSLDKSNINLGFISSLFQGE